MRNPGENRSPIKAEERAECVDTSENTCAVSASDAIMGKYKGQTGGGKAECPPLLSLAPSSPQSTLTPAVLSLPPSL